MNADERAKVAQQFGVAPEHVERDHLIWHLLAFLSQNVSDRIHFIGGTALARTHLPDGRLSEDIDLITIDDRKAVAADLDAALPLALARIHGRLTLDPLLSGAANTVAAILRSASGILVRIQLLWPAAECCGLPSTAPFGSAIATRRQPNLPSSLCRVRRVQDSDVGGPARNPRPLGPMGAQQNWGY